MSQTFPFRLNLAHLAWSLAICAACASDHLPLEVDTESTRGTPELAGSSGVLPPTAAGSGAGSFAGSAGGSGWPGSFPSKSPPPPPREVVCGDNVVDSPQELCDRRNLNGASCLSLGFNGGGVLLCNPTTCYFDTIMCRISPPDAGAMPAFDAGVVPPDWGPDDDAGH